jgi:H+-translocating NAD(P) transhydrogenase subunit beta
MAEGLLLSLYIFVLAIFVGFEVITKVPQMLHTPLMSGSNAISGITLVGAVVVAGRVSRRSARARRVRRRVRHDQRRRRLHGHRPHAPDVPAQAGGREMNEVQRRCSGSLPLLIEIAYLVAAVLFIVGLKRLSSPKTARSATCSAPPACWSPCSPRCCTGRSSAGLDPGGCHHRRAVGVLMARTVKMTGMPQMVALLNGFGGGASALVAGDEYLRFAAAIDRRAAERAGHDHAERAHRRPDVLRQPHRVRQAAGADHRPGGDVPRPEGGQRPHLRGHVRARGVSGGADANLPLYLALTGAALVIGVLFVMPIGGADMPVVISLLNSFSGIAASMTGFVLGNNVLIISGALVGASGIILTKIMCDAMNRSLTNVLFGAFGANVTAGAAAAGCRGWPFRARHHAEDAAILLAYARSVVFVPGYGMAVSQAQHQVRELADLLQARGVDVKYAIHPVAGRMPGHMNVLLAEANVPYPQLIEMERSTPSSTAPTSPSSSAPTTSSTRPRGTTPRARSTACRSSTSTREDRDRHEAQHEPGLRGHRERAVLRDNTRMLFGDARKSLTALMQQVKAGVCLCHGRRRAGRAAGPRVESARCRFGLSSSLTYASTSCGPP